jgi:hypothetical protein
VVEGVPVLASIGIGAVNYVAWGAGAGLLLWIVIDAIRVSRDYSEEFLVSSLEGAIERESGGPETVEEP